MTSQHRAMRPRARLLRTIGRDLISSEKVALIELVKNSYDADASRVSIRFRDSSEGETGMIEVVDDGHGMDSETLESAWLDIASDRKKRVSVSEGGRRRVLGEKGIGRLAAARLGNQMLLVTRRRSSDEIQLLVDWTEFDRQDAYLDEIQIGWRTGTPRVFSGHGGGGGFSFGGSTPEHGTAIQITGLTQTWTVDDFRDLRTALARLIRPKPTLRPDQLHDEFRLFLQLPDAFDELGGEVEPPRELSRPHYKLLGYVAADGRAKLEYTQYDGEETLPLDIDLWSVRDSGRQPESGPFEVDIEVWDRDAAAIKQVALGSSSGEFRRLLNDVAGVSVYRDGFRVLPFGEPGDDWLGLDRRRVQNPTLRLSNNQVIGHVFIGADENELLRDQSNREGLIEGESYDDLKVLVQAPMPLS